jgi:hypothetical protein
MEATITEVLSRYREVSFEAMELRVAIRDIKRQLAEGGDPEWTHRAGRAYARKCAALSRAKDEMKTLRIVLRSSVQEVTN